MQMKETIRIRGARQHNLKGIDVDIPRRAITVVTGVSGSGKSSLAFDTLYAEGQRRYVESLSAYARQFLERMEKPLVDSIEGISPAVAIAQTNPTQSSRSTVGTATEIYDYLRLLWARIGRTYCPVCGRELRPATVQSVTDTILEIGDSQRFVVAFPLIRSERVTHDIIVDNLRARGFVRVLVNGKVLHLDDLDDYDLAETGDVLVVADRLSATQELQGRIADAVQTAFREGDGNVVLEFTTPVVPPASVRADGDTGAVTRIRFTDRFECPNDGTRAPTPTPQLFSFNNPRGACAVCNGFGATLDFDINLIVPDTERTLRNGAIDPWTAPRYEKERRAVVQYAQELGVSPDIPWRELPDDAKEKLLHDRTRSYKGIYPFFERLEPKKYKAYIRIFLRKYQSAQLCRSCHGARLQAEALQVRIAGRHIAAVAQLPINELQQWIEGIALSPMETTIAETVLREARSRTRFLAEVGLTYLTLDRATRTLSGGEMQRISLANALGSSLVDATYVLDEPSIGLHPRDLGQLLSLLTRLRDHGNTVVMVEHDLDAMKVADYMIELGPQAGAHGGEVVFAGPMQNAAESPLTGKYITGSETIALPTGRRSAGPRFLQLKGATANNVHEVDLSIPLGVMTAVTGVSGSGKSTIVHDILFHALEKRLHGEHSAREHLGETVGAYESLRGEESIADVVLIDQSPIGRTPRSNPVTYVKAYDEVRRLFSETPLARTRGYAPGHFSFNVAGGRCETCEGAGSLQVEMLFMADVYVPCEACGGKRFRDEVLEVRIRGLNIADVLNLTIDEAIRFFPKEDKLAQTLWHVQQVGLGYLRLGQPATTLSGGEAQRLKIARELAAAGKKKTKKLYIMDEPTTGLHLEDVKTLASVLDRLLAQGNTILVIEHNMELVKLADWVIDMGPGGGANGGRIVASGTPEAIAASNNSATAPYLREVLERGGVAAASEPGVTPVARPSARKRSALRG